MPNLRVLKPITYFDNAERKNIDVAPGDYRVRVEDATRREPDGTLRQLLYLGKYGPFATAQMQGWIKDGFVVRID